MDRAPISVFNSTTKACAECAHFVADDRKCGRASFVSFVTGATVLTAASIERAFDTSTGCGPSAKHFTTNANGPAAKAARRAQIQLAIEAAITDLHPDTVEAQEIMQALEAALESRYDGRVDEAMGFAKRFRDSLDTVVEPEVVAVARAS